MKNFIVEYIDRTPLRVFLINVEENVQDAMMWSWWDKVTRNRLNTYNVLIASQQVNYYRHPEIQDFNNTQMTQLILGAIESGRTGLFELGKRSIPSVSFTSIPEFFKYVGFDMLELKFKADSIAGQVDARIGRK